MIHALNNVWFDTYKAWLNLSRFQHDDGGKIVSIFDGVLFKWVRKKGKWEAIFWEVCDKGESIGVNEKWESNVVC